MSIRNCFVALCLALCALSACGAPPASETVGEAQQAISNASYTPAMVGDRLDLSILPGSWQACGASCTHTPANWWSTIAWNQPSQQTDLSTYHHAAAAGGGYYTANFGQIFRGDTRCFFRGPDYPVFVGVTNVWWTFRYSTGSQPVDFYSLFWSPRDDGNLDAGVIYRLLPANVTNGTINIATPTNPSTGNPWTVLDMGCGKPVAPMFGYYTGINQAVDIKSFKVQIDYRLGP